MKSPLVVVGQGFILSTFNQTLRSTPVVSEKKAVGQRAKKVKAKGKCVTKVCKAKPKVVVKKKK